MNKPARKKLRAFIVLACAVMGAWAQTGAPEAATAGGAYRIERGTDGTDSYTPLAKGRHTFSFGSGAGQIEFDSEAVDLSVATVRQAGKSGKSVAASSFAKTGQGLGNRGLAMTVRQVGGPAAGHNGQIDGMGITGPVWEFGPEKLRFTKPARLTLPYTCPEGMPESQIQVFWYNESVKRWEVVPKLSQDMVTHTITATIDHFSSYTTGISSNRKDEAGTLAGLGGSRSERVDPYFGTLLMDSTDVDIPARGIGFGLESSFNSDYLYSQYVSTLSGSFTSSGNTCVSPKNYSPYEYAAGWSYLLPFCNYGTYGALTLTIPGGSVFDLTSVLNQFGTMTANTETTIDRYLVTKSGTTLTVRIPETGFSGRFTIYEHAWSDTSYPPGDDPVTTYYYEVKATSARLFYPDGREAEFTGSGYVSKIWDPSLVNGVTFSYSGTTLTQLDHTDGRSVKIYSYAGSSGQTRIVYILSSSTGRTTLNPGDLFLQRKTLDSSGRVIAVDELGTVPIAQTITSFTPSLSNESTYSTVLRSTTYGYSLSSGVTGNYIEVQSPGKGYSKYTFGVSFHPYGYCTYSNLQLVNDNDPPGPPNWVWIGSAYRYYQNKPKVTNVVRKEQPGSTEYAKDYYTYESTYGLSAFTSSDYQYSGSSIPSAWDIYPSKTTIATVRVAGSETALVKKELFFSHTGDLPNKTYLGVGTDITYKNSSDFYTKTGRSFTPTSSLLGSYRTQYEYVYIGDSGTSRYTLTHSYDSDGRRTRTQNSLAGSTYTAYLNTLTSDTTFWDNPYTSTNNFTDNLVKGFGIIAGEAVEQASGSCFKTYRKYQSDLKLLETKDLEYDANGTANTKTVTSAWNSSTNTLASVTEPWGDSGTTTTSFSYGSGWKSSFVTTQTKELGANIGTNDRVVTTYDYDLAGRRLQEGSVVTDSQGAAIDGTKYPAATSKLECDGLGRVTKKSRVVSGTETTLGRYEYGQDTNGLWSVSTDGKGFRVESRYDFYGRLVQEMTYKPDIRYRDASYTGSGKVAIGKVVKTWDMAMPSLVKSETVYLDAGLSTQLVTSYSYDVLGRPVQVQSGPNSGSLVTMVARAYDDSQNTVTVDRYRDGSTYTRTRTQKDWLGRTSSEIQWDGTNGGGNSRTTSYAYNFTGQVTSKTMPNGEAYTYVYTRAGRLQTESYPMGRGSTSNTYYPDGRVKVATELNGDTVSYTYNKAGMERTRTTASTRSPQPATLVVTSAYCQYGPATVAEQRGGESTPSQTVAWEYGVNGIPAKESRTVPTQAGSKTAMVVRTYDLANNPASVTVTGFGGYAKTVVYETPYLGGTGYGGNTNTLALWDNSQNLLALMSLSFWGGRTAVSYGTSGGTAVYGYDTWLRMSSVDNPGSLCDGSYTYDRMGNVTGRDGVSYGYDGMNRLSTGGGTSYGYDAIGNLTQSTGTDPASYGYATVSGVNSMLLRNITHPSSQAVTDDSMKRGWVTGVQNRYASLVWDVYGRLEGMGDLARNAGGTQTDSYRYYPDGLRYRKDETSTTGAVTTTLYVYEGNEILLKERMEGSTWKTAQVNVRLGGMEVGRYVKDYVGNTERLEYVWQDNLGSRRAVTNTAGTVKAKIDYAVWGGSTVTNYNGYDGSQDVSYTGKERDATGLYYFNARYYDCVAGRFYSEDPVRDGGNWFVYCGNNPLSATDPSGLAGMGDLKRFESTGETSDSSLISGLGTGNIVPPSDPPDAENVVSNIINSLESAAKLAKNVVTSATNNIATAAVAVVTGLYGGLNTAGILPPPPALVEDVCYPLFDGFLFGASWETTLPAGSTFDRYGNPRGSYASPIGTPKEERALPPWNSGEYTAYRSKIDLEVKAGIAGPYYGSAGGGIQYMFRSTLGSLIDAKLVEVLK